MFKNFSRRNHLDKPDYDLKYEYVPPAFRMDLYKAVRENCEIALYEYCLFRDSAISINKLVRRFYSVADIEANYSPDYFIEMLLDLEWHQVLSVIEFFLRANQWYKSDFSQEFLSAEQANALFEYHKLGYRVEEGYRVVVHCPSTLVETMHFSARL